MFYLSMFYGFIIILGIALLYYSILSFRSSESLILSIATVVAAMYLSSYTHNFANGVKLSQLLALAGILVFLATFLLGKIKSGRHGSSPEIKNVKTDKQKIIPAIKDVKTDKQKIVPRIKDAESDGRGIPTEKDFLGFLMTALLFLCGLVLFFNARVHIFDELHQWAAAIRYMYEHNTMPYYEDFLGYTSRQYYGVGLFCLFFEKLTGWSEPSMYMASYFISLAGILLPVSNFANKNYKKAAAYVIIVMLAVSAIYVYGFNSLYVDLPTMTWTGGLAAWWYGREKKKSNIILIVVCAMMIFFFKIMIGAMLAASILGLFILEKMKDYALAQDEKKHFLSSFICWLNRYRSPLIALACLALVMLICLEVVYPSSILWKRLILANGDQASDRLKLTLAAFMESALGKDISSASGCGITYIPMLAALIVLNKIRCHLSNDDSWLFDTMYLLGMNICYCVALLFSYLLMFSYQESIHVTCIYRYFCIPLLIFFMIYMMRMLKEIRMEKIMIYRGIYIAVFLFFVFGASDNFISIMTSWDNDQAYGSDIQKNALEAFADVEKVTGDSKVYMIDQKAQEYTPCVLLYYYQDKINNYLFNMWSFTENGSYIFNAERTDYGIDVLPIFLEGYEYLWIYHSNDYLHDNLPLYVVQDENAPMDVEDGQLYRILSNDGQQVVLEQVK